MSFQLGLTHCRKSVVWVQTVLADHEAGDKCGDHILLQRALPLVSIANNFSNTVTLHPLQVNMAT